MLCSWESNFYTLFVIAQLTKISLISEGLGKQHGDIHRYKLLSVNT